MLLKKAQLNFKSISQIVFELQPFKEQQHNPNSNLKTHFSQNDFFELAYSSFQPDVLKIDNYCYYLLILNLFTIKNFKSQLRLFNICLLINTLAMTYLLKFNSTNLTQRIQISSRTFRTIRINFYFCFSIFTNFIK